MEKLLAEILAAQYLGVSVYRLQKWRCYGGGPRWVRVGGPGGRAIRYRQEDLDRYIQENTFGKAGGDR